MKKTKKIKYCIPGDSAAIRYLRLRSLFGNCISGTESASGTDGIAVTARGLIFIIILTLIPVIIMILFSGAAHAEPDLRFILDQGDNAPGFHGSQSSGQSRQSLRRSGSRSSHASEPGHAAGSTWTEPVTGMVFVWVPKGCFEMGSNSSDAYPDEHPVHKVCVDGFWIGKYEVTQGQWKRLMHNNPSYFKYGDNYPVEQVSWSGAKKFISQLNQKTGPGFALPTEAQWEYAARSGGKNQKYSGGNDADRFAWYGNWLFGSTQPVGTKAPNGLGIYDMSGNVWEWCEDVYDRNAYSKHDLNNPLVESGGSFRVYRGGCWYSNSRFVRCANRVRLSASGAGSYQGFRLIRKN